MVGNGKKRVLMKSAMGEKEYWVSQISKRGDAMWKTNREEIALSS